MDEDDRRCVPPGGLMLIIGIVLGVLGLLAILAEVAPRFGGMF